MMQASNKRILYYCISLCLLTGVITYILSTRQSHKTCVVDAVKLFDHFNLKKELEGQAKIKLQGLSNQLDSVGNRLKAAEAVKDDTGRIRYMKAYNYLKANLENDYSQSNSEINTEVWKRLNPLVEEWGKKNNYHLIFGANGMGSILYTDDYYDRTDEVIKYVNKRYEEGN